SLGDVPDHAMSVDPRELAEMVSACERTSVLLGDEWIGARESERPARANARRSIVLERDVEAGAVLALDDLGFKRPGTGLPPAKAPELVGRRMRESRPRGTVLAAGDVEAIKEAV